jgi:hypothetical protein
MLPIIAENELQLPPDDVLTGITMRVVVSANSAKFCTPEIFSIATVQTWLSDTKLYLNFTCIQEYYTDTCQA